MEGTLQLSFERDPGKTFNTSNISRMLCSQPTFHNTIAEQKQIANMRETGVGLTTISNHPVSLRYPWDKTCTWLGLIMLQHNWWCWGKMAESTQRTSGEIMPCHSTDHNISHHITSWYPLDLSGEGGVWREEWIRGKVLNDAESISKRTQTNWTTDRLTDWLQPVHRDDGSFHQHCNPVCLSVGLVYKP